MYSIDKKNFKKYLIGFPKQISESQNIFNQHFNQSSDDPVSNIIYLGMGGSAIAGDVICNVLFDDMKVPLEVVRGYEIPGYCSPASLVIVSSYSGNTEETLTAVKKAAGKGAKIHAITSGGELAKLAHRKKWPLLPVPEGFPPRQAMGYLFFLAYQLVLKTINKKIGNKEFDTLIKLADSMVLRNDEQNAKRKVFAKELALRIKGKIPIIYTPAPYLSAVSVRWKNQFQENSKSMAFNNMIPEMNHNEIVGWEMEFAGLNEYIVLFLESEKSDKRVHARTQLTKSIIRDRGIDVAEVYTEGKTRLEQILSLLIRGDWVSYYLALLYEKDPIKIVNIDYLKSELKKLS